LKIKNKMIFVCRPRRDPGCDKYHCKTFDYICSPYNIYK